MCSTLDVTLWTVLSLIIKISVLTRHTSSFVDDIEGRGEGFVFKLPIVPS